MQPGKMFLRTMPRRCTGSPWRPSKDTWLRRQLWALITGRDEAFLRVGTHTENGAVTLRSLVEGYAQHAENHARQLQEIRVAYKAAKGKK